MNDHNLNENNLPEAESYSTDNRETAPANKVEAHQKNEDAPAESTLTASESTAESAIHKAETKSEPEISNANPNPEPLSPNYSSASHEKVYIGIPSPEPTTERQKKAPRARLSAGTTAIIIAVCVLLSGCAAFVGTLSARIVANSKPISNITNLNSTPSVIFKSYENPNKTVGTYEQVAEAVSPTVVEITTESLVTASLYWGDYVTSGAGSGVIISADGIIVTNNHVVSGASSISVRLTDGNEYPAEVIGADSDSDIAIIKINAENLPFALLGNSDEASVGQEVLAVGNPLGELGGTVTNGIISALSREVNISGTEMTLIQMNAEVNPGNSGGGLFNLYGELIGIVNAKSTTSSSGTSVEGIGFAVPINTASKVVDELVNYGYVRGKAILGINYKDITTSYEAMIYNVSALGIYVTASNQPALEVGDRIVAIDGQDVSYSADVKAALKGRAVGDTVTVTVVRKGRHMTVNATLIEKVPTIENESSSNSDIFKNNFNN